MPTSPMNSVIDHLRRAALRDSAALGDRELLACFIERHDEAAFAALVKRHGPMVWGVCRRLLSHHDAEDAFQATFLVLVRKAASIVPREMVGNWLYGVAHQAALQARRSAARRRAREVQVTVMPDTEAVQQDQWPDVQPVLDQELSRLPDNYRAVIVLCDLEGRTRKEVARQLGVPEGTVAGRLARARAMLAKRLTGRGVTLSGGVLAAVLARNVASAGVPDSVVSSTITAASFLAAGQVAAAGPVSVKVAALTEGVLKAMMMSKLKAVVALLVLGCIATGGIVLCWRTGSAQGNQPPALEIPVKPPQKQEKLAFTAWGKEAGGLQAGLGYLPGQHRTYHTGETVTLVVRVRNVSKVAVKFQYLRQFFDQKAPTVTDGEGKSVHFRYGIDDSALVHLPANVNLAPGKEMALGEVKLPTRALGTGKFTVQYERVFGKSYQGTLEVDPTLKNLGTGKLDLEIKAEPPPAATEKKAPQKQAKEKEGFTAWGKKVGGLQAGLGYLPGQRRTYHTGETVTLVVRVRNVSKEVVKFQYDRWFIDQIAPAVTDDAGKPVHFRYGYLDTAIWHPPTNVSLAPGKEMVLGEVKLPTASLGTGKFTVQYERVFGKTYQGTLEVDPTLKNLGTGKLDVEIKSEQPPAAAEKQ